MGDAALSSAEWEGCNSWWLWHCWNGLAHPSLRLEKKKIKAKKGIRALTKKIIKPVTRFPEVPNAARGKALEIKEI